jgi:polyhydroxyalkanoate synthesis regulator phasin
MAKKDVSDIPYLLVGIGVAVQEEIMKAADRLIDKGKSLTPEGRKKMAGQKKGLVSKGDDFSKVVARTVQRVLENTGIVTRADMEDIDHRVDALQKKVNKPAKAKAAKPAVKKKAAKKPAKKKKAAKKPAVKKTKVAAPSAVAAPAPPVEIRPLIERP